jgi:hypothetical protein
VEARGPVDVSRRLLLQVTEFWGLIHRMLRGVVRSACRT